MNISGKLVEHLLLKQAGVPVLDCEQPRSAAEDSLCRRYFNDDRDNRANQPDHERRNAPGQGPLAQPRANTPLLSLLTGSEPLQPQNEPDNLLLNTTLTIAVLIFIITVLRLPRFLVNLPSDCRRGPVLRAGI